MKLIKLLFSLVISAGIILAGYYFVWNFMAKKRALAIQETLDKSAKFDFDHKGMNISGYPDNIIIKLKKLRFDSKDANNNVNYTIGDVIFKIYPFVIQQQAEVLLPKNHYFKLNYKGVEREFKLQTSNIDLRFLDNTINVDLTDLKIFEVTTNKMLLKADKFYYTGYLDSANKFKFNLKNLQFKGHKIDSVLFDIELNNVNKLDIYAVLLNMLILEGQEFNDYFNENIEYLQYGKSGINIRNMKLVHQDDWFELETNLKVDRRTRLVGNIEIVSNKMQTAQDILTTLTSNEEINIADLELIQRLMAKNSNKLIRISGKMERGFLHIFNEKVARVKPFKNNK